MGPVSTNETGSSVAAAPQDADDDHEIRGLDRQGKGHDGHYALGVGVGLGRDVVRVEDERGDAAKIRPPKARPSRDGKRQELPRVIAGETAIATANQHSRG